MTLQFFDNGYIVIFGSICMFMVGQDDSQFMGSIFQFGSIMNYAVSYFRLQNNGIAEPDILFLVIPLQTVSTALLLPLGYKSILKFGTRRTAAFGTIFTLACFFTATFVTKASLFVVLFGLSHGIGAGISYIVPVAAGWRYFPAKKGFISGLTSCAYAYAAFTFSIISNRLINPDNIEPAISEKVGQITYYYFQPEVANRFPIALRWECLIWLCFTIISICLIRSPSEEKKVEIMKQLHLMSTGNSPMKKRKDQLKESLIQKNIVLPKYYDDMESKLKIHIDEHDFTMKEILTTREFWWLYVMGFFSIFFGFFMASAYKNYGIELIFDDAFLSLAGAIAFATNGTSRLVLGSLLDCFNFKVIYAFVILVQIVVCGTMDLLSKYKPFFLIYVCIAILFEGAHLALFPTALSRVYGARSGKFAFSLLFSSFMFSTLTGALFNGYVLPSIGFANVFYICGCFSLISLVMLYFYHPVNHAKHAVSQKFLY